MRRGSTPSSADAPGADAPGVDRLGLPGKRESDRAVTTAYRRRCRVIPCQPGDKAVSRALASVPHSERARVSRRAGRALAVSAADGARRARVGLLDRRPQLGESIGRAERAGRALSLRLRRDRPALDRQRLSRCLDRDESASHEADPGTRAAVAPRSRSTAGTPRSPSRRGTPSAPARASWPTRCCCAKVPSSMHRKLLY